MKKRIKQVLIKTDSTLEVAIAIILSISIFILILQLLFQITNSTISGSGLDFNEILTYSINLVIGLEFIRMLCLHSPSTVFEVLVFAVARQIIVDHSSAVNNLIGAIAIAILFATRKYLFCNFDEAEKTIFRGTQKVSKVNHLSHLDIPCDEECTLEELVRRELSQEEEPIGVGSCIYFPGCALRIDKIKDGVITRVELIRAIH